MSASPNMHILGNNMWISYIKLMRFIWSLCYQYEIWYRNYFSCRSVLCRLANCANIQYLMAVWYRNASACFCVTETNLVGLYFSNNICHPCYICTAKAITLLRGVQPFRLVFPQHLAYQISYASPQVTLTSYSYNILTWSIFFHTSLPIDFVVLSTSLNDNIRGYFLHGNPNYMGKPFAMLVSRQFFLYL